MILVLALLNWFLLKNTLKLIISIILFVVAEILRRKGDTSKAIVIGQIIAAIPIVGNIIFFILSLFV